MRFLALRGITVALLPASHNFIAVYTRIFMNRPDSNCVWRQVQLKSLFWCYWKGLDLHVSSQGCEKTKASAHIIVDFLIGLVHMYVISSKIKQLKNERKKGAGTFNVGLHSDIYWPISWKHNLMIETTPVSMILTFIRGHSFVEKSGTSGSFFRKCLNRFGWKI